jgi:tetratricopeptide (TPR) repeat protein
LTFALRAIRAPGALNLYLRNLWLANALLLALTAAGPALAQRDESPAARAAAAAFVFSAQETQNAIVKAMDDDMLDERRHADALAAQLTDTRAQLANAQSGAAGARSKAARLELQVAELSRDTALAQEQFASRLASKDQAYARELQTLRSATDTILSTPEGVHVLDLYNAGDWQAVKALMPVLIAARRHAADLQSAADARAYAVMAFGAAKAGREQIATVIDLFDKVTQLDPGDYDDWITLTGLYSGANDLSNAGRAAKMALQLATTDSERGYATLAIGQIDSQRGDLVAALHDYRTAIDIAGRITASDANAPDAQRMRIAALSDLAEVLRATGDKECLTTYRDAGNAVVTLLRSGHASLQDELDALRLEAAIAQVVLESGKTGDALPIVQNAIALDKAFLASHPDDVKMQLDMGTLQVLLGDVMAAQQNLPAARSAYEAALAADKAIVAKDATFGEARSTMSADIERIARIQAMQGDFPGALAGFQDVLTSQRALATADPSSLEHKQDIVIVEGEISDTMLASGNISGAAAMSLDAIASARALVAANPASAFDRAILADATRRDAAIQAKTDKKEKP